MNKLNNNEIADSKEFIEYNQLHFGNKCVVPIFGAITKAITIKLVST